MLVSLNTDPDNASQFLKSGLRLEVSIIPVVGSGYQEGNHDNIVYQLKCPALPGP